MFLGSIINSLSVLLGGLLGTLVGKRMTENFRDDLNLVLGLCAITMGVSSLLHLSNLPAAILSVILGTCLGLRMKLGRLFRKGGELMQKGVSRVFPRSCGTLTAEQEQTLITAIVLFCASGTGIYGAIVAGMTGDHGILLTKSVLDFVTAMVFACSIGVVASLVAIPQFCVYLLLLALSQVIYPLCTPEMINDFKAVGGVLLLATGFRMMKVKAFPVAEMIPGIVLAMPVTYVWMTWVIPFLA